jgi:predicted RNase H-like HicB family nuclease
MVTEFTVVYTPIPSGYMGQLLEWPEVISEGESLEACRQSIQDALKEMILAYQQQNRIIPMGDALIEKVPVEV